MTIIIRFVLLINALGKINYDTNDGEFRDKICTRLYELINEAFILSDKIIQKDIAFAFGNYKKNANISYLMDMMKDDFYGVRFLAADALKLMAIFITVTNEAEILKLGTAPEFMNTFLYSLTGLSENNFIKGID
jgi:hypothetical protein